MICGWRTPAVLMVVLAVVVVPVVVRSAAATDRNRTDVVVVTDPRLTESSALAVSPDDPALLYTVNDSGHDPVVYVVDRADGAVVGTTALAGLDRSAADTEALAVDRDGTLWVADIGDNLVDRTDVALYALPAPGRGDDTVTPDRYLLRYPPGDEDDAETLLSDPSTDTMWLVSKGWFYGSVYELPDPLVADRPNRLRLLPGVRVPLLVTDGTVLPGPDAGPDVAPVAVLRTYVRAYLYTLPDWRSVGGFPLPRQPQGEALTGLPGGRVVLAGSEGSPTRIDRVRVPPRLLATLGRSGDATASVRPSSPQPGSEPDPSADRAVGDDGIPSAVLLGLGAGIVLAGAAVVLVARRRRTSGTG